MTDVSPAIDRRGASRFRVVCACHAAEVDETWTTRELPALRALVEHFDDPYAAHLTWEQAAELAGMDQDKFRRALAKLAAAEPPFIEWVHVEEEPFPVGLTGVTERALGAVGQWPSPEGLVAQLVAALNQAADDETQPDRQSKLRMVANALRGMAREVAIAWAAGALPHP